MTSDDRIEVCIRTAQTGHLTLALPLEALPAFADEHLAAGRAVIAEYGDESLLIRVGREILNFFRGRRRAGEQRTERVTVTNPMAGGVDGPDEATTTARVLLSALQARNGQAGNDERLVGSAPISMPGYAMMTRGAGAPLNPEAEMRAWQALCEKEGTVQVIRDGQMVAALCLQLTDGGSVWDAVANRLSLLRSGEDGEIRVWATANATNYR